MDLVSVIVPVYNVEKYLNACVVSITGQTYTNLEIILIDDGSTDSSGKICDDLAKADSRIKVIHKKNGGLSDARNTGLDNASGEWIIFVDSDDFINLKLIDKCQKAIHKYKADIAVFNYEEFEKDSINVPVDLETLYWKNCSSNEMIKEYVKNKKGTNSVCNKMYYYKVWNKLRFPKGKIHEDEFVIIDIYKNAKNVIYTNYVLYYYRQRKGSIMSDRKLIAYYNTMEAFRLQCKKLKYNEELYVLSKGNYLGRVIETYIYISEFEDSRKKKLLKHFRRMFRKSLVELKKYLSLRKMVLLGSFYINPCLYQFIVNSFKTSIYKKIRKLWT